MVTPPLHNLIASSIPCMAVSLNNLGELKGYVTTNASMQPLAVEMFTKYTIMVLTNSSLDKQLRTASKR